MLDPDFVAVAFSIVEKIVPKVAHMFIGEAINKRINTEGLTIAEASVIIS